jgi:signal recognition particle subunit SRP19
MPTLEEIDDVDNMDFDLAEFDPSLRTPLAPKLETSIVRSQDQEPEPPLFPPQQQHQQRLDEDSSQFQFEGEDLEYLKSMQVLYPCYFDSQRSHSQGRRVPASLASPNPMAQTIANACVSLHLKCVFEPDKSHPQDYGNPGRVRVALKHEGQPESVLVSNKRELMKRVGEFLKRNPSDLDSLLKSGFVPEDFKGFEPREIPKVKGFKMNTIVPVFSKFTLGHPMTKSIYEARPEVPEVKEVKEKAQKMKNKYRPMRR